MAEAQLVTCGDCYFVRYAGEESHAEVYGNPLDYTFRDGKRCLALVDAKPRTDDVECVLDEWVYWVSGVADVEIVTEEDGEEEEDGAEMEIEEEPEEEVRAN